MVNKESVLSFFRERKGQRPPGLRPLSFKEIASLMRLSPSESRALRRVLRELLRDGKLVLTRKRLYGPAGDMNLVTGYFEAHRGGYGFVIPDKPGRRDVFIPPRATLAAMDGDRVIARLEGARQGSVIRILERAHTRIAGTIDITRDGCYVRPKNRFVPFDIYIAPKDRGGAKTGKSVIVEITSYPTDKRPPSGRVVKVVDRPEEPRAEVEAIIEEFGLPKRFPRNARDEAKFLRAKQFDRRKDLGRLPTVTIDGERAKDFDDAVSIKLQEHGYTLWVHIADVGFYVHWDSPLDLEARKRGTSVYFPDRVIPMLPKELSEDLCSLKPGLQRPAFTVEMSFDRFGRRTDVKFYPSLIMSNERMTYTSVRKILVDQDGRERKKYSRLLKELELMGELCGILRSRRLQRGSLDFDLPEPEILLDIQGRPEAILAAERNFAHMIIEEFMIAANEAVAEYLFKLGVPVLYRIHEEPDPVKIKAVMKSIMPVLGKKNTPWVFHELLKAVKGLNDPSLEETVTYVILRNMKQARYSHENTGHFGLASKCYTHFTSPIRRYPDLVVHRILKEVLSRKRLSDGRTEELEKLLPDIAFSSSRRERLSDKAEKEVVSAMRVWFMKDKVGDEFDGRIVDVTPHGLRVRLKDFYVEGFLHVSYMTDDFYQYNDRTLTLSGKSTGRVFRVGQELRVRVDRVDIEEREIVFGTG